ncbi:lipopolysaccharide biosynthesis protein [Mycobacterium sp. CPCC 205372]|uniref:Lipopolysaccharide biosynthesis protein n=1 Tax=Mycobacterium hippophais TaxID=3016340 RepID=A0ABT4PRW1_9MYCO|nr:lipopolysaccharide biosynthesis protein [Mycobacterium hippophais]MCZ8379294.1 lipopolysaccharide biosynthesis protein [Mycobacterium hippophais]
MGSRLPGQGCYQHRQYSVLDLRCCGCCPDVADRHLSQGRRRHSTAPSPRKPWSHGRLGKISHFNRLQSAANLRGRGTSAVVTTVIYLARQVVDSVEMAFRAIISQNYAQRTDGTERSPFDPAGAATASTSCPDFGIDGELSDRRSAGGEFRHSFGWRVLTAGGGMAASFALTVLVVRGLPDRDAATFFAILAALAIGPLIGRFGLGTNVIRLVPAESDPAVRRQIAGTHLLAVVIASSVSAPVIAIFGCNALIGHEGFVPVFILATLLVGVESTRLMVSDIFAATGRIGSSVATTHYVRTMLALPFVAATMFALGNETLVGVLTAFLGVAVVQFAVALLKARTLVTFPKLGAAFSMLRTAAGQGVRVFSIDLSEFMIMQGTIWLATAALTPVVATQYALAITLGMQVALFKNLAASAVAPPAARLWAAGARAQVVRVLSSAATLSTAVAIGLVVLIAAFGSAAVAFAYGNEMRPTATMLLIIAFGGTVQACFSASVTLIIISGHLAEAAHVAIAVLVVAAPTAVAAAVYGGPIALSAVTATSLAVMYTAQYFNTRKCLGSAPRANRRLTAAARELLREPAADDVEPAGAGRA